MNHDRTLAAVTFGGILVMTALAFAPYAVLVSVLGVAVLAALSGLARVVYLSFHRSNQLVEEVRFSFEDHLKRPTGEVKVRPGGGFRV